ncbi:MAG: hypothetical protein HN919_03970 [Verrucomicrobia bacterium]|jgi:hypothetical protein|nr:hypothetical protein [Verrucomicrobiota bacterium]MBT7701178.1 hypothetical protein [Verrucomicrobiota bacterium]
MQTYKARFGNRNGNALITVLGIVMVISAFLVVGVNRSLQRAFTAHRLSDRAKAQSIAEAGAARAYVALQADFTTRTNAEAFPITDYSGGTYHATIIPVDEDGAVIRCLGQYAGIEETVMLDTRLRGAATEMIVDRAYGYAILADGDISWTGCGTFGGESRVHGNGKFKQAGCGELAADVTSSTSIRLLGNSGEIDGDVAAPDVSGKTGKVTGTITETAVAAVPIPTIDLVAYYNQALQNGEVYQGSKTISTSVAPVGGIMWIEGNLKLSGPGTCTGCFIATGNIHLSGPAGQVKVGGYPAFISRDGSIKLSGSGSYEGLLYAPSGDIDITGGGSVTGSMICGGDFKKAGCSTLFSYVESVPVAPNETVSEGILCISAWQQ